MDWQKKLDMDIAPTDSIKEKATTTTVDFNFSSSKNMDEHDDIQDSLVDITAKDIEVAGISVLAFLGLLSFMFPHATPKLNDYSFLGMNVAFLFFLLQLFTLSSGAILLSFFIHDHKPDHFIIKGFYDKYLSHFKPMKKKIGGLFFAGFISIGMIGVFSTIFLPAKPIQNLKPVLQKTMPEIIKKDIIVLDTPIKPGNYQEMVDLANIQKAKDAEEIRSNSYLAKREHYFSILAQGIHNREKIEAATMLKSTHVNVDLALKSLQEEQIRLQIEYEKSSAALLKD